MEDMFITRGIQMARLLAAVVLFLVIFFGLTGKGKPQRVLGTYRELKGLVFRKSGGRNWYQNVQSRLTRYGATFHYGRRVAPLNYFIVRILLSLVCCLTFGRSSLGLGLIVGTLMFFLPDWLLVYLNKKDNEKMLPELKLVYHTMEIQIKAGVYVLDALSECYGGVSGKRLKAALLDLTGDFVMRADVYDALDSFQSKFDNGHIDSLCVTVLQALESGQAVELLKDLGEQVKDVEQLLLERKKASLDRSLTFYQLGILAIVLGITLYVCVVQMLGVAVNL